MRTVQSSATLTGWKRYERSGSILQLPHRRTMTRLSDHYIPFGLAARTHTYLGHCAVTEADAQYHENWSCHRQN
jgi:hypothetical protein